MLLRCVQGDTENMKGKQIKITTHFTRQRILCSTLSVVWPLYVVSPSFFFFAFWWNNTYVDTNMTRYQEFLIGGGPTFGSERTVEIFSGKLLLTETITCFSICERRSPLAWEILGSLSKGVFERRTSTGSEVFFILKHLDAPKFVFLSVLTIIETSCPKRWAKPLSKNEKRPLPFDVRRSKTSLLKFTTKIGCAGD